MSRRLVLTADDLGHDRETNREIVALLQEGRLTASTLLVVGPEAAHAAGLVLAARMDDGAPAAGRVPVPRLHIALTSPAGEPPWRPVAPDVRSLTDDDGAFHVNAFLLGEQATAEEVERELEAQLAWMGAAGLQPAGLDSHAGILYGLHGGPFLDVALAFCARHGLPFRMPRSIELYGGLNLPPDMRAEFEEYVARAVATADGLGVRLPAEIGTSWESAGELGSYEALRAHYVDLLCRLPEGTSEIFLHPAPESAVEKLHGPDGMTRAWELRLLRDPAFAEAIAAEGIELVSSW
ncbi:carbohydrate deacetylase [Georgenia wangjunii]|uniref:carbohydrate deacetylase n=1 Tax=Georgenia wangjunii TaxID=3117730 RepID=UPI002F26104A